MTDAENDIFGDALRRITTSQQALPVVRPEFHHPVIKPDIHRAVAPLDLSIVPHPSWNPGAFWGTLALLLLKQPLNLRLAAEAHHHNGDS